MMSNQLHSDAYFDENAEKCIGESVEWIKSCIVEKQYFDDYLLFLTKDETSQPPIMAIAECLMVIMNLREPDYREFEFSNVSMDIINKNIHDLIEALDGNIFSGWPYIRFEDMKADVDFTDCVNYVLGAITRVYRTKEVVSAVDKGTKEQLFMLGQRCLDWLLDNQVCFDFTDNDKNVHRLGGWRWASIKNSKNEYVQTYFTTQALTTLLEALFEAPLLVRNREEEILKRIVRAKRFIECSIIKPEQEAAAGWVDVHEGVQPETTYIPEATGDENISLYALEVLSYVKYYTTDSVFRHKQSNLQKLSKTLWDELSNIDETVTIGIDNIVQRTQGGLSSEADDVENFADKSENYWLGINKHANKTIKSMSACRISVPSFVNTTSGGAYIDGAVPFNKLNAILYSFEQFGLNSQNYLTTKRPQMLLRLSAAILRVLYRDNCFQHLDRLDNKAIRYSAIYSTRSAISTFLSLGIKPRQTSSDLPIEKLQKLAAEFSHLLNVETDQVADDAVLSQERIRLLFVMGASIGLLMGHLGDVNRFAADPKLKNADAPKLRIPDQMAKFDVRSAIEANIKGVSVLVEALYGQSFEDLEKATQNVAKNPFTFENIRTWLIAKQPRKKKQSILEYENGVFLNMAEMPTREAADQLVKEFIKNLEQAADNETEDDLYQKVSEVCEQLLT